MFGTRTALLAIVMADGLALLLGGSLGLVAGYARRPGRCADHAPGRCAAGVSLSAAGADHRRGARPSLTNSVIAIGIIYTPQYARLMRGQVLTVQAADFVVAARSIGAGQAACDAAPCTAEQLHAGARARHAAIRRGGGGDGRPVVPRPRRATAVTRLGRIAGRWPRLFPYRLVDRHVSLVWRSSWWWSASTCWATHCATSTTPGMRMR